MERAEIMPDREGKPSPDQLGCELYRPAGDKNSTVVDVEIQDHQVKDGVSEVGIPPAERKSNHVSDIKTHIQEEAEVEREEIGDLFHPDTSKRNIKPELDLG